MLGSVATDGGSGGTGGGSGGTGGDCGEAGGDCGPAWGTRSSGIDQPCVGWVGTVARPVGGTVARPRDVPGGGGGTDAPSECGPAAGCGGWAGGPGCPSAVCPSNPPCGFGGTPSTGPGCESCLPTGPSSRSET
ncbi:hypothetical protein Prubr_29720 [Polymorphospora rubra]|uniref:Uncharacterized protein n=1 Tax=Polymorphospora rubra TaxID=338584 RepID=A0A810MXI9_9ACTN|nr:hypothetical protein Prubr_29720 [Polymorphospora rubra]